MPDMFDKDAQEMNKPIDYIGTRFRGSFFTMYLFVLFGFLNHKNKGKCP